MPTGRTEHNDQKLRVIQQEQERREPSDGGAHHGGITALLAGVLYNYAMFPGNYEHTPRAGATTEPSTHGFKLNIIDIDTEIAASEVDFWLRDAGGVLVPGCHGNLAEIPGLLMDDECVNFSYMDADQDQLLSSGDEILVKDLNHGGPASKGYSLRLSYTRTGDTIVEKTF